MLRRILQQKIGTHVPIHPQKVNNDFFLKSECKKVTVSIIKPTCSDEMSNVKEYMFKTFYKEAPIPIVLKVGKSQKKFVVSSMLQKTSKKTTDICPKVGN